MFERFSWGRRGERSLNSINQAENRRGESANNSLHFDSANNINEQELTRLSYLTKVPKGALAKRDINYLMNIAADRHGQRSSHYRETMSLIKRLHGKEKAETGALELAV